MRNITEIWAEVARLDKIANDPDEPIGKIVSATQRANAIRWALGVKESDSKAGNHSHDPDTKPSGRMRMTVIHDDGTEIVNEGLEFIYYQAPYKIIIELI